MRQCVFILTLTLAISVNIYATIRTVSNNPAYPGQYPTLNDAIVASSVGDTIYVMPSNTAYPAANLDKRLVIIGAGIDPRRPSHLGTSIPSLNISAAAANSSIMGIYFYSNGFVIGGPSDYINNLYFSDCSLQDLTIYGNNLIMENCIFNDYLKTGNNNLNNIYQNNIFNYGIYLHPPSNAIIRNNIFASGDAGRQSFPQAAGGEFMGSAVQILNNIFYKNNPAGGVGQVNSCTFIKNIYFNTNNATPANATSSGNLNADPLFVSFPGGGSDFNFQNNYKLQPASPAINYGTDGKDLGMWGGQVPVNAGFEPPIPRIYDLTASSTTVPVGGTLQLTIKATKAQ